MKALDKSTLETRHRIPWRSCWTMTNTQFAPVHKATVEKFGKDWVKPSANMVGNGAYVFKDWQVNNRIIIEKNPSTGTQPPRC